MTTTDEGELHVGRAVPGRDDVMAEASNVHEQLARARFVLDTFELAGKTVLDVGCGTGYSADYMRQAASGCSILGIDPSPSTIEFARERYPDIEFDLGDATNIQDFGRKFDYVLSFEVLEHVSDQDGMVRSMAGQAKPDGHVILSTPNRETFSLGKTTPFANATHVRELDRGELTGILERHFHEVRMYGQYHRDPAMQAAFLKYHLARYRTFRVYQALEGLGPRWFWQKVGGAIALLILTAYKATTGPDVWGRKFPDFVIDESMPEPIWFVAVCRGPKVS